MTAYYIPYGRNSYCIVDEKNNLLDSYGDAYKKLDIEKNGTTYITHYIVTKDMKIMLTNETAIASFHQWTEENENNLPLSDKAQEKLDKEQELKHIPF